MTRLAPIAVFAFAAACTPAQAEPAAPSTPSVTYAPGQAVSVSRAGRAWPASVVRVFGDGRYLIHYEGFGSQWDEVVSSDRVLPAEASLPRDYRPGEKVLVKFQGRTLLAEVVAQVAPTQWRVRYDGFGDAATEDVGPERLRRPYLGSAPFPAGSEVTVDFSGKAVPGTVLAVIGPDSVLVRFDGYKANYDQDVKTQRVAARAGTAEAAAPVPGASQSAPVSTAPADLEQRSSDEAPGTKASSPSKGVPKQTTSEPLKAGDTVAIAHGGAFHLATLVSPTGSGWKVKYAVSGEREEEVAVARIVPTQTAPKGQALAPNTKVFIEWHGVLVPGKVLKEAGKGLYKVRFDDSGPEADEVVPVKRLRPRA